MPTKLDAELARLEAEQANLSQRIDQLKDQQRRYIAASDEVKLSIILHDAFCHWNHTDGCGWHYENESFFFKHGSTKTGWLIKATQILQFVSFDEASRVVDAIVKANANG